MFSGTLLGYSAPEPRCFNKSALEHYKHFLVGYSKSTKVTFADLPIWSLSLNVNDAEQVSILVDQVSDTRAVMSFSPRDLITSGKTHMTLNSETSGLLKIGTSIFEADLGLCPAQREK